MNLKKRLRINTGEKCTQCRYSSTRFSLPLIACPQAEGGCPCTVTVLFVLLSSYLFPWVSNIPSPLIPLIGISAARWRCPVSKNLSETSFDCVPLKYFIHLSALSVFFYSIQPCSENVKPNNLFLFIFMNPRLPHYGIFFIRFVPLVPAREFL